MKNYDVYESDNNRVRDYQLVPSGHKVIKRYYCVGFTGRVVITEAEVAQAYNEVRIAKEAGQDG